ncbi:MAG: OmpA family protein [Pseudomonadota bacterium]|nr:OmpA family protein [Pseudomonadota bacterium]
MFDSSGRKVLIGVVTGTLLSTTALTAVWAATERETHHLLNSEEGPVLTKREGECVQTPKTPNQPPKFFKECGDIGDRDGDGVPDDEDQCPDNTPEEISQGVYDDQDPPRDPKNQPPTRECDKIGCPIDTDGDGVGDYADQCPDTSAEYMMTAPACTRDECVDAQGCVPDEDGDGVIDCKDQCRGTPAHLISQVDSIGCAEVEEPKLSGTITAETLFDFDKAVLKSAGKEALNSLIAKIRGAQDLSRIEVLGHTDPVGSNSYNQGLSERRAQAVANYLVAQGIAASVIQTRGLGETDLVERLPGESTKQWHARCRRVEIISYVKQ